MVVRLGEALAGQGYPAAGQLDDGEQRIGAHRQQHRLGFGGQLGGGVVTPLAGRDGQRRLGDGHEAGLPGLRSHPGPLGGGGHRRANVTPAQVRPGLKDASRGQLLEVASGPEPVTGLAQER
jgi:hypothetical protein